MQPTIVLPGLRCDTPDAVSALRSVALPALSYLLGRARIKRGEALTSTAAFSAACGLPDGGAAVLRRAGETGLPLPQAGEIWLCADPVGLHFARDQLVLSDADSLAISAAEAAALQSALAESLRSAGEFVLAAPDRGYLRLAAPSEAEFADLLDVAGRPVALFLPEGRDGIRWGRIINETQITLHELPLNRAREAAGKRLINSVWFWGEAQLKATPNIAAQGVFTDSPIGRGLARLAGKTAQPLEAFAQAEPGADTLLLIESLDAAARFRDTPRWLDSLIALEARIFEPLARRMQRGEIKQIRLLAPGEREGLSIDIRAQRWSFWLKPQSPECLLAPLSR